MELGARSPDSRAALVVADFLTAVASFLLAGLFRFGVGFPSIWEVFLALPWLPGSVIVFGGLVVVMFWSTGSYRQDVRWSFATEVRDVLRAVGLTVLVTLSLLYFARLQELSRLQLAYLFVLLTLGATVSRAIIRLLHERSLARGLKSRRLMIVGTGGASERVVDSVCRNPALGLEVAGYLGNTPGESGGLARLGGFDEIRQVLVSERIDEVAICLPMVEWEWIDAIVEACREQGIPVRIPVGVGGRLMSRSRIEDFDGLPMLAVANGPDHVMALVAKRVVDLVGAVGFVVGLSPLLIWVALTLWILQGRPIFFSQQRGGLRGRPFAAFKFRTMIPTAEQQKSLLNERNERVGPAFKVSNDPRITRIGRWLRITSIDELPQLFNVIVGDMSLVGPRPQPIEEVQAYDFWHRRRLSMKPGITGLWQVTARNEPSFDKWVDLDLEYIDRWSLWLDLKILALTPIAVVKNPGV